MSFLLELFSKNTTIIDLSNRGLKEIPDLSGFTFLQELYISHNNLEKLPNLPPYLERLDCSYNKIKIIKELPSGLIFLNCTSNQINKLPIILPKRLRCLYCSFNKIEELPELPFGLSFLFCADNELIKLPNILPERLSKLSCSNNKITYIPKLSKMIETLNCDNNKIMSFNHDMPEHIFRLNLSNNPICDILNETIEISDIFLENKIIPLIIRSSINTLQNQGLNTSFIFQELKNCVKINIIQRIKTIYYDCKRSKFIRKLCYEKIIEPKMRYLYSPLKLNAILDSLEDESEETLDKALDNW
jgi:Leucine-rich repeat (LRR) protein